MRPNRNFVKYNCTTLFSSAWEQKPIGVSFHTHLCELEWILIDCFIVSFRIIVILVSQFWLGIHRYNSIHINPMHNDYELLPEVMEILATLLGTPAKIS